MARYSLFVLKVPLNPKQTNKQIILLFHCSIVWLCCSPAIRDIHCTYMARYSLFVLKVPLNNNKPKPTS